MVAGTDAVQKAADLRVGVVGAQQGGFLGVGPGDLPGLAQDLVPGKQRGTQGTARIARGGLNPDVLERALAEQPAVGDAVQRHAAGHHQILGPSGALPGVTGRLEHHVLGDPLNTGRQIHVPLLQPRLRLTRRAAEELGEPAPGHPQALAGGEVGRVQRIAAVVLEIDQVLPDQVDIPGLAVGCQAHQLVLAAVDREAAVVREGMSSMPREWGKRIS